MYTCPEDSHYLELVLNIDCQNSGSITFFIEILDPPLRSCQPRPSLAETGNRQTLIIPAYVSVFRCQGGQRPQKYQCQPVTSEVLKFHTFKFGGEAYAVEVVNHTSCKEVCVCGRCLGGMEEAYCEAPEMYVYLEDFSPGYHFVHENSLSL